jgi:hypothetical protein
MSTVIKIENLSKQYRPGNIGTSTLKGDLQRWLYTPDIQEILLSYK